MKQSNLQYWEDRGTEKDTFSFMLVEFVIPDGIPGGNVKELQNVKVEVHIFFFSNVLKLWTWVRLLKWTVYRPNRRPIIKLWPSLCPVKTFNGDVNKQLEEEVLEIQNFMGERGKDSL